MKINNSVGMFITEDTTILDYRNLSFKNKLMFCWKLLMFGIVEIQWKKVNLIHLEDMSSKQENKK